jgi:hypothetical protein
VCLRLQCEFHILCGFVFELDGRNVLDFLYSSEVVYYMLHVCYIRYDDDDDDFDDDKNDGEVFDLNVDAERERERGAVLLF